MSVLYRARWASCLTACRPNHDPRPALDELVTLGFGGIRVFCGQLPWCGQELRHVYDQLPRLHAWTKERGLYCYQAYHTEAGTGYALDQHTNELVAIDHDQSHVLREVANEADHPTQNGRLPPARCRELAARMAGPVGYGATITNDESDLYAGGHFVPVHLDRGRPKWDMVRRVREVERLSEATGKPAFNQEPIGAAETSIAGKRESDPAIFFTLGALNRIMECLGVFHSEDGLWARPLSPNQRRCAELFVQGSTLWPDDGPRLSFRNSGQQGSPVHSANFIDPGPNGTVVRVYSGIAGNAGLTCALGITRQPDKDHDDDPGIEWQNGWTPSSTLAQYPGVTVWSIRQ